MSTAAPFFYLWSFLFNMIKYQNKEEQKHCIAFQENGQSKSDINGDLLRDKIVDRQNYLNDNQVTLIEHLDFIKKHNFIEIFPNT